MPKTILDPQPLIAPYGDSALYLSYQSKGYNPQISATVLALSNTLRQSGHWEDVISGYDSLVASFNPLSLSLNEAGKRLEAALSDIPKTIAATPTRTIDVPVYYGGENGPDRHTEPRLSVPAGSVGIAGWQTGIYGLSSPGGWQIIGRTPLTIFDAARETPFLWGAGDKIRFVPTSGTFPATAAQVSQS